MASTKVGLSGHVIGRFEDAFLPQRIVFGAGEIDRLPAHIENGERFLICTSRTYTRNGGVERVRAQLGNSVAGVFDAVRPHVPEDTVAELVQLMGAKGAGSILALGGGSAIGTAKAAAASLAGEGAGIAVPLVAVPTTYAGSEMTAVYGITRRGRKVTVRDPRILPRLVIYDLDLTLDLPAEITAGTGANALAHCVEGVYSSRRTPVGTACALAACGKIAHALPALMRDGRDRAAREEMLVGAHLAGVTLVHAGMALHHAICHALGGAGVPHGIANAIMLPHVMRFNLDFCRDELSAIAGVLPRRTGQPEDAAESAIAGIATLLQDLPLPHRLRETVVSSDQLTEIAAETVKSSSIPANPRPVASAEEIEEVLRWAW